MKRLVSAMLLLALMLSLCSCGKGQSAQNAFSEQPSVSESSAPTGQPAAVIIESPKAFSSEMVSNAGFRLGEQTIEDIVGMFGQPTETVVTEYSSGSVTSLKYPFGSFEFDTTLYYVEGFAGITGPQGITAGMHINEIVELFCKGSSALLTGSGEVLLYGEEGSDCGRFTRLTVEFVGEYGSYQLDYFDYTDAGRVKLTIALDNDMRMTAFTVQLS